MSWLKCSKWDSVLIESILWKKFEIECSLNWDAKVDAYSLLNLFSICVYILHPLLLFVPVPQFEYWRARAYLNNCQSFFVNRKKSDFPRFSLDCEVNLMWKSFFIGNDVTHWVVIVVVNDNVVNFFSGFSRIYITCNWLTVDWISAVLIFTLEAIPTPCIRNRIGSIWASIKIHYGWISGISGSWIVCCVI